MSTQLLPIVYRAGLAVWPATFMQFPLKLDSVPSLTPILTPTNVAVLASLGVHAFVMGLALPSLQGSDTEKQTKGQVGVVELTETEQSRLPDTSPFSNSSTTLGDPAGLPSGSSVPGAANNNPALNLPTSNAPLPSTDYNYNALPGQLPSQSSLPPLPPLPPISETVPSYPSYPSYPNLPGSYSGVPSYPNNYGSYGSYGSYGRLSRLPVTTPPLPSIPSSGYNSGRPFLPSNPINTDSAGNRPSPNRPQFDNASPAKGTDFISKAPQAANLPGNTNNPTNNIPSGEPGLVAQGQDTSSEDALRNDLYARAKYGNLTSSEIEVVNLVGNYPRIACRNRTEASVVYYVDPSGAVTRVSESRYPIFNTSAQQIFQSQRFVKPTRVTVNFKYDPKVCASIATANPTAPVINTPSVDSPGILPPRPIAPEQNATPLNTATQPVPPLPSQLPSGSNSPLRNETTSPTNVPTRNETTGNNAGVNKTPPPVQIPANARVNPIASPNAILTVPQTAPSTAIPQAPETSVKPNLPPIPKAPTSNIPLPQTRPSVVPITPQAPSTTVKTNPLPSNLPSVSPPKPEAATPSPALVAPKPKPETLSTPSAGTNLLDNLRSRLFRANPSPQNQPTPAVKPSPPELSNKGEVNPVSPPSLGKK